VSMLLCVVTAPGGDGRDATCPHVLCEEHAREAFSRLLARRGGGDSFSIRVAGTALGPCDRCGCADAKPKLG